LRMQGENVLNLLQKYGLTKTQAQIFIHLIKAGACSVGELSKSLKTNRMNIYRNLKSMENIGLVSVIPGRPMKFSAVPIDIALNTLLSAAKSKVLEMESSYATILEAISKISEQQREYTIEAKFRFHSGRRPIYAVMMQMLEQCRVEACLLTTPSDLICLSLCGFDEALKKLSAMGIKAKILTNIADEKIARVLRDYAKYAVIRHAEVQLKTRLLIVDDKMAFTSLTVEDSINPDSENDSGFWTDSPQYVGSVKEFFNIAWRNAQDASAVLYYLKTGKVMEKIITFNEVEEYHRHLVDVLERAENEVLLYTGRFREPYLTRDIINTLEKICSRGVNVKIITYLDEYSQFLEKISNTLMAKIKHAGFESASISFIIIDESESLVCCFLSSNLGYIAQAQGFWSNITGFVQVLEKVFMELWSKATNPSIRLAEIQFRKAIKEMPEVLAPLAKERGFLFKAPAVVKGSSGLNHKFNLTLSVKGSNKPIIVCDYLPENNDVEAALVSLYVKAMDVKANLKILLIPTKEMVNIIERELAVAYGIELIDGLHPAELCHKLLEIIAL